MGLPQQPHGRLSTMTRLPYACHEEVRFYCSGLHRHILGLHGRNIAASPARTPDDAGSLGRLVDDRNYGSTRLVD